MRLKRAMGNFAYVLHRKQLMPVTPTVIIVS